MQYKIINAISSASVPPPGATRSSILRFTISVWSDRAMNLDQMEQALTTTSIGTERFIRGVRMMLLSGIS